MAKKELLKKRRKAWIKALRSGKYKQCQCILGDVDENGKKSYCCLGVACEVAIKMGKKIEKVIDNGTIMYDGEDNYLPKVIEKFYGIKSDGDFDKHTLIDMNDEGVSFKEIADFIEKEPNGLFV